MKNTLDAVVSIMKVMSICICLAACSGQMIKAYAEEVDPETKTKKAYEIPANYAGGSVLEGTVTMVGDRIISCDIKEFNTMLQWGDITNEEIAKLGEDNIQTALFLNIAVGPVNTVFAKFVQVGDIIFTAGVDGKGFITYTSDKTGNVITFFEKSEDHIAWYIEQLELGNYWILKKKDLVDG